MEPASLVEGMSHKIPMREVHASGAGSLGAGIAAPRRTFRKSSLLSDGSIQEKAFRVGTSTVSAVAWLRNVLSATVTMVAFDSCMLAAGAKLNYELCGISLVLFFIGRVILSSPVIPMSWDGKPQLQRPLARLLLEWGAFLAIAVIVGRTLGLEAQFPRHGLTTWFLLTPVALVLSNYSLERTATWWLARRPRVYRHIIVGATEVGLELAKRVERGSRTSSFMGFFDFRQIARLPQVAPDQWAGPCNGVAEFVRKNSIDAIYIALPISTSPRIAELVQDLRDTTASVYFVPNILNFDLVQPRCMELHGIPLLAVCETPIQGAAGLGKRMLDLLLASIGLTVLAPLLLVIAAAVRLSSSGPALFRQRRYGLGGEEIRIFKFRTMRVCEDSAIITQVRREDERVTALGRFLRRYSIDELPQLLNVLRGNMSIVGPRPHAVTHNEQYRKLINGYMIRHKVRPGITGWAQVNGLRGETDTVEKMHARVEYDLDYIRNWTIWLDIKIMVRTLLLVANDHDAY
jgi:putative colanic acid biosynthesis UDP-glucose lipid carrier transferase